MKGQAQDLDKEVNGVAGELALGPAPVAVFDEQARIGGQLEVVRRASSTSWSRRRCRSGGSGATRAARICS